MSRGFPDGEDGVAALLEQIQGLELYFRTPDFSITDEAQYEAHVPFVVIRRLDGAGNDQGWERTEVVEVQQFSKTRVTAKQLARDVEAVLTRPEGVRTAAGYFDQVRVAQLPNEVPYAQEDVRRDVSTWALTSRQQDLDTES
ncbi:hypothetical protein ACWEOE_10890 [Amycolatopsis sp. NPDC004368]